MRKAIKIFAIFFAIATILMLANPSIKRFNEYIGHAPTHGIRAHYRIVYTVYEVPNSDGSSGYVRYLGFFFNFFKISS